MQLSWKGHTGNTVPEKQRTQY